MERKHHKGSTREGYRRVLGEAKLSCKNNRDGSLGRMRRCKCEYKCCEKGEKGVDYDPFIHSCLSSASFPIMLPFPLLHSYLMNQSKLMWYLSIHKEYTYSSYTTSSFLFLVYWVLHAASHHKCMFTWNNMNAEAMAYSRLLILFHNSSLF